MASLLHADIRVRAKPSLLRNSNRRDVQVNVHRRGRWLSKIGFGAVIFCVSTVSISLGVAEESHVGGPVNGLKATLTVPHSTVHQGQHLPVELELRNIASTPFSIYQHVSNLLGMPGQIRFLVRGADGTSIEMAQEIDDHPAPIEKDYVRLEPEASFKREFLMTLEHQPYVNNLAGFEGLSPGKYELSLEVFFTDEGRHAGVKDAWVGVVISNPVTFEVVSIPSEK